MSHVRAAALVVLLAGATVSAAAYLAIYLVFVIPSSIILTTLLGYLLGRLTIFPSERWFLAWQLTTAMIGAVVTMQLTWAPGVNEGDIVTYLGAVGLTLGLLASQWGKLMRLTAS